MRIAGVLLVFILLIAPAVCGAMFARGIRGRLFIGWGSGILATILGLGVSARMDWPPAPAISCVFAVILGGAALVDRVRASERRGVAAARFAASGAVLTAIGFGLTSFLSAQRAEHAPANASLPAALAPDAHSHGEPEHGLGASRRDLMAALTDEHENVRARAVAELGALRDPSDLPRLLAALEDPSDAVKENAARALGALGRAEAMAPLEAALRRPNQDEWVNLHEAEALVRCGGTAGLSALIEAARHADAKLVRQEALTRALAFTGLPGVAAGDEAALRGALDALEGWWTTHRASARWDAAQTRFVTAP